MLATAGSSNQQQSTNNTDCTKLAPSPTNAMKNNIKSEPFSTALSPENTNSQNIIDETNNGVNSCGSGNNSNSGSVDGPAVSVGGGGGNTPNIHRQNSTNANNTTSSPKNGSDHSNCSNISQMVEGSADLLHDEKKKKIAVKDEDNGKTLNNDKSSIAGNNAKSAAKNQMLSIKEEPDTLGGLVNVKKEENLSPKMSPVGFGSIGGPSGNTCDGRSGTPAIKVEHSNNASSMSNINNNNEKTSTPLGLSSDDTQAGNGLGSNSLNDICTGSGSGNNGSAPVGMNSGQPGQGPTNFISGNSGGPMGNCMDYMQQQNHIFVFSTQLANKGAESVLSGQFQTIIAYHCTQPATKNFLEDFFMKNPMKMNKLQRQNSLNNMCNLSGAIGQPWMNNVVSGGGPLSKLQQQQAKPTAGGGGGGGGKANLNQQDMSSKTSAMRLNSNVPNSFAESVDALANENDLMCWEQTRNTLESGGASENQAIKLLESGSDTVNNALNKCTDGANSDSTIPSLQGVKVPDENLTPQQRQHRDEQLAKLKKINQFLFPENDSSPNISTSNQLNKLVNENMPGNVVPASIMNIPPGNAGNGPPNMSNPTINASMRQMQPNMMIQTKSDHLPGGLGDEGMLPGDVMGELSASGAGAQCVGGGQKNACVGLSAQGNMSCASGAIGGVNVGNISVNNMQCHSGPSGNLLSNSPELIAAFGNPTCGGVGINDMAKGLPNADMPPVGMAQMEWSKMQQQFFEERLKGSKAPGRTGMTQNNSLPSALGTVAAGPNQLVRGNQGPPPPYHPTQRSASVPIATQSPNPASPNNPTSNLSLPSPRTTGALGIPANSPNMDAANASNSTSNAPSATSSTTLTTTTTGNNITTKNCFQPDGGSPSNRNRGASGGLNQFNSNPSTPLSHMSPKDLETFSNNNAGDLKNPRPSPQRTRSPSNANNLIDTGNIDGRFPSSSPGLNFNPQMQNNLNAAMNTFKGAGPAPGSNPLERQNCGPGGAAQFCRRTDNMPLNPNSNRPGQNKINQGFDPISSLAQMSQQLTSCVSSVGSSSAGGMNVMGPNDINMVNQNIEGMIPSMDTNGMDHMNNAVPFGPGPGVGGGGNNCHPMSPLMNSMGQRMLNPKMCGSGFNPGPNGPGMREGHGPGGNFHGVMPPSARMIGRMPVNFGNFNVSPNIQVKASTPNTIQYMPVRPQSNNNNIRMPPSLEFLQRYANPQMAAGGGGPMGGNDNGHLVGGPMNPNMPNEASKMGSGNPGNMPLGGPGVNNLSGMNFFQNCNQVPVMDDDGIMTNNGMMPPHDINIGQPMIRGMRPHGMRQHGMGGPRMQAPNNNIIGSQQPQYPGPTPEVLDCPDPAALFNAGSSCNNGPNGQGMFGVSQQQQQQHQQQQQQQQQQKNLKSMPPGGLCQNMNAPNVPGGNANVQGNGPAAGTGMMPNNDIGVGMQQGGGGSVMIGGNIPSGPGPGNPNNNPNYKQSFVGPSSNDLKYAQQYHSFQQQLYATTTRSQQQQGPGNLNNMAPNLSPNPAFFANK